jgi:hypothetical protein
MKLYFIIVVALLTLVGAAFLFFARPSAVADRSRLGFQKNLKLMAKPEELQRWAVDELKPFQSNEDPSLWIAITNLPLAFSGVGSPPSSAYIYADSQGRFDITNILPYIIITYGSASGHFGLLLGPTNLPAPPNREHVVRYTFWASGLWFFDGQ